MASANSNYTDLITTTLEFRGDSAEDNVSTNNALWAWLKANGGIKLTSGGHKIIEPLAFATNSNGGWYSGYDQLPVAPQEEFSAAEFNWKQIAVPVVASGLETEVQNTGKEALFDLLEERIKNAERTMANLVSVGLFGDGTGSGGKTIDGLAAMCDPTPTVGTYGNINRANFSFWQNKFTDTAAALSSTTIQAEWNTMYYSLVRGNDKTGLIIVPSTVMGAYEASLQANQRFTDGSKAKLGFDTLKYKSADVVMDGNATALTTYMLDLDFIKVRVAKNRNFKPLKTRQAFNQDAEVVILAAALNLTCSNAALQGRIQHDV